MEKEDNVANQKKSRAPACEKKIILSTMQRTSFIKVNDDRVERMASRSGAD
jgi:hypothetical protein